MGCRCARRDGWGWLAATAWRPKAALRPAAARHKHTPRPALCTQVDGCVSISSAFLCWGEDSAAWEACPDDLLSTQASGLGGSARGCLRQARLLCRTARHPALCAGLCSGRPCLALCTAQAEPAPTGLSAATVPLPVVPLHSRITTAGEACRLPTVYQASTVLLLWQHALSGSLQGWETGGSARFPRLQGTPGCLLPSPYFSQPQALRPPLSFHLQGELLDDCIMRDGAWSCLNAAREWQTCNLGATPVPTDEEGQLLVAQVGREAGEAGKQGTDRAPRLQG